MVTTTTAIPTRTRRGEAELKLSRRPAPRPHTQHGHLLDSLAQAQATMMATVLDGEGIDRVAELAASAAGGPVAVLLPRLGAALASEGSHAGTDLATLEQWLLKRLRGRPCVVPPDVIAEAPIRFRDELVGVVVLLQAETPPHAEASEFLQFAAAAVLTGVAIEDAKEETEQNLRGSFLEELRCRHDLSGAEIVRRASRLGCDLSSGAVILCAELTSDRPRLAVATIAAEYPGALAQELDGGGGEARPRVYAALPAVGEGDVSTTTVASARRLAARMRRLGVVGLSSFHADPAELGDAVREAELVLEVLQHSGATVTEEIGTGTYKLLFRVLASHPEEVNEFYESTIASMVSYDQLNRTELVHTLRAYLESNCNMNATAAAIFAHRHTIAYRLERIHELTGLDPLICEDRERLGLALKVHRLLAPQLEGQPAR
jgi:sugar diacid utilization regulator